jgi:hypothetical protein
MIEKANEKKLLNSSGGMNKGKRGEENGYNEVEEYSETHPF